MVDKFKPDNTYPAVEKAKDQKADFNADSVASERANRGAFGQQPAPKGSSPVNTQEPAQAKAFTGAPTKPDVTVPPVDPMIEQARQVERQHPAIPATTPAPSNAERDLAEHLARQASSVNPKAPGPVSVTRPEWEEDDKGKPAKPAAMLQKPVVPGMAAMRANAPQEWKIGTMPMPEPAIEAKLTSKPDPKPVSHAANVKKSEGITFIPKYKKFLAEFKASGQIYNAGMYDTEPQAIAAIATAKAHLYP